MLPLPISGQEATFRWVAPRPLDDLEVVVVNPDGANWSAALLPVRAKSTIIEGGIDAHRRTLTLDEAVPAASDPIAAGYGDVFLVGGDALVEGIAANIDGTFVELGASLRAPLVTPAELHWAHHVATLPAGVTSTARDLGWTVVQRIDVGTVEPIATGTLSVRPRVFETGLTVPRLHQEARWVARMAYARLSDQPAIDASLDILRKRIARKARLDVDTIANGQDFLHVHVRLAEAQLHEDPEQRQALRNEAWSLLDDVLEPHLADEDGDGVVEGARYGSLSVGGGSTGCYRPFSDTWGI